MGWRGCASPRLVSAHTFKIAAKAAATILDQGAKRRSREGINALGRFWRRETTLVRNKVAQAMA
jgi:hypothetical protein